MGVAGEVKREDSRLPVSSPSTMSPFLAKLLLEVEVAWNGLDNIGVPISLHHSPPVETTRSGPAREN